MKDETDQLVTCLVLPECLSVKIAFHPRTVKRIVMAPMPSLLFRCFSLFLPHLRTLALEKRSASYVIKCNLLLIRELPRSFASGSLAAAGLRQQQIAPSPAAHALTCCEDFCGCCAGEMASEVHEIFYAFGPQLNTFLPVGIWLKYFRRKLLQFE